MGSTPLQATTPSTPCSPVSGINHERPKSAVKSSSSFDVLRQMTAAHNRPAPDSPPGGATPHPPQVVGTIVPMQRSQLAVLADGTRIEPSLEQPESSRAANFGHSSNSVTPAAVMVPLSPLSPHNVSDVPCDFYSMEHQRSGNDVLREACVLLLNEACALPPQCSQLSRPSVEKSICVGLRLSPAFIDCLSQLLLILR